MTTIIFIWYLFTLPTNTDVCRLWINHAPTAADLVAACPPLGPLNDYRLRVAYYNDGQIACDDIPGDYLPEVSNHCRGMMMYELYTITIYRPGVVTLICPLRIEHDGQPTPAEIADQCPQAPAQYELKFSHQTTPEPAPAQCVPPAPQPGPGLLDSADQLTTDMDLHLLAARLIWNGFVTPDCNGWSGIDPLTGAATACGLQSARAQVRAWQNRYDTEILAAAATWHIPPRLLKRLAIEETQLWPWTGNNGELGLTQITEDGIDMTLLYYQTGYATMPPAERQTARAQIRARLDCPTCSAWQAAESARDDWDIYAAALAAYYCANGRDWSAALRAWNVKHDIGSW